MKEQRVRRVVKEMTEEHKVCKVCHKEFWGLKKAKFCSVNCRNKEFRAGHAEKLRQYNADYYRAQKAKRLVSAK